jgi:hypothetical protein
MSRTVTQRLVRSSVHETNSNLDMKIPSHKALLRNSIRNKIQLMEPNRTQHQLQSLATNLMCNLMEPVPLVARTGRGSVKAKMRMGMMKPRSEIQRGPRVCYHLPEIKTTPASSHVHIESMMPKSIAFDTAGGVLVP